MKIRYSYRVTSTRENSSLQPQTFTHTLGAAIESAAQHARELAGCSTKIESRDGDGWKLWHSIIDFALSDPVLSDPDPFREPIRA